MFYCPCHAPTSFYFPWAESDSAIYHCVSRVVDRQFVLGREEKDVFVRMMREYEAFCGVQVLSCCVMSNHFHVLVENGYAARVMAAYIDLNPIRAGMVSKPEDYKWCSYGEAMQPKHNTKAREGLYRVLASADGFDQQRTISLAGKWDGESGVAVRYRMMLFADGEEAFAEDIHSGEVLESRVIKRVRKGFRRKDVERVLAKGGKLSFARRCVARCGISTMAC